MTIITSKEELEEHLKKAREDIVYGRTVSFDYMKKIRYVIIGKEINILLVYKFNNIKGR